MRHRPNGTPGRRRMAICCVEGLARKDKVSPLCCQYHWGQMLTTYREGWRGLRFTELELESSRPCSAIGMDGECGEGV